MLKGSMLEAVREREERKLRKDRRGRAIVKGRKTHSISFRDEVCPGEHVASFKIVESFKTYNVDVSMNSNNGCGCRVL